MNPSDEIVYDPDRCNQLIYEHGHTFLFANPDQVTKATAEEQVKIARKNMPEYVVDWHYVAGRPVFKRMLKRRYDMLASGREPMAADYLLARMGSVLGKAPATIEITYVGAEDENPGKPCFVARLKFHGAREEIERVAATPEEALTLLIEAAER